MSEAQPIAASPQRESARAAIARAAQATGVDFKYLLAQAQLESNLDPSARAGTSSAAGLFQFTRGTWQETLARHGAEHGFGPTARGEQAQALRFDPDASALMAAELARDNGTKLAPMLGRQPDSAELYLAHFLGAGGAKQFLSALASDPGANASQLFPEAAAANPSTFRTAAGAPRSVAQMMDLLRTRLGAAMDSESTPTPAAPAFENDYLAIAQQPARAPITLSPPAPAGQGSMADVLGNAFGLGADGGAPAPAFVRTAYARLRGMGL